MTRSKFVLTSIALAALFPLVKPVMAQSRSIEVTWISVPTAIADRGDIACPGGDSPSPSPYPPWCPSESRTRIRNRVQLGLIATSSDPRISGSTTEVINANLDSALAGPGWGTSKYEIPGRGTWEGTAVAEFHGPNSISFRIVLHGSGEFEGMKVMADGIFVRGQGTTWVERILDTRRGG